MKKFKIILNIGEYLAYLKSTFLMLLRGLIRIPCLVFLGCSSLAYWLVGMIVLFCKENTKVAVIIGFVLCFLVMFCEFIYFKLQIVENSYQTSELIKKNYMLEQTDRYDIGYHDAMAKNKEMLNKAMQ